MDTCVNCGGKLFNPGQNGDMVQGSGQCPSCGAEQPYRDQPSPTHSDMEARGMPVPGANGMDDMGGNPLQEGIWANTDNGWQNRMKRDESYASVRSSIYLPWNYDTEKIAGDFDVTQVVPDGPRTEEVDVGEANPLILQHDDEQILSDAAEQLRTAGILGALLGGGAGFMVGGPAGALRGAMIGNTVGNAIGGASKAVAPSPQAPVQGPNGAAYFASLHDELTARLADFDGPFDDHPSSKKLEDTDDPEDVDPHEKNDGDNSFMDDDVDKGGGSDQIIPLDSDIGQKFQEALPFLLDYYDSPESGADHPKIKALMDSLPPELLEGDHQLTPEEQQDLDEALAQHKGHHHAYAPTDPASLQQTVNQPAMQQAPGTQMLQQPPVSPQGQPNPISQASCPNCGARLSPGSGLCPQCGSSQQAVPQQNAVPGTAAMGPGMAPTARVAGQGPQSPEQMQAVKQYLQENGQYTPEVAERLIDDPDSFADVLAEVTQRQAPPQPDPNPGPPPPAPDPSQMGMDPAAMQGGGGPPGGGMPMMGRTYLAVDSAAPPCPKCGSHTTGMTSEEGDCHCHNCGNDWSAEATKLPEHNAAEAPDMTTVSPDVSQRNTGWNDTQGQPLVEGQQYDMYTQNYDVPDTVTVTSAKPGQLEYELTGAYNLSHRTHLTREEADIEGVSFQPSGSAGLTAKTAADPWAAHRQYQQQGGPWSMDDHPDHPRFDWDQSAGFGDPQEGTQGRPILHFPSSPQFGREGIPSTHVGPMGYHHNDLFNAMQGHVGFGEALPGRNDAAMGGALKGYEYENGARQWFPQGPEQEALQQQLNERMGTDPTLTHDPYADLDDEDWGDDDMEHFGAGPGGFPMEPDMYTQGTSVIPCPNCRGGGCPACAGTGQQTFRTDQYNHDGVQAIDDMTDHAPPVRNFGENYQRNFGKVAGKKFTPMEQREFIDEPGVARNANKLDLKGTHYEDEQSGLSIDDFLW